MKVTFKANVRFKEFSPELEYILHHLRKVEAPVPEIVVTSVNDSEHMTLSKHYSNQALDVRTKNFKDLPSKRAYQKALQDSLGTDFAVILEFIGGANEHIHVQLRKGLSTFTPS